MIPRRFALRQGRRALIASLPQPAFRWQSTDVRSGDGLVQSTPDTTPSPVPSEPVPDKPVRPVVTSTRKKQSRALDILTTLDSETGREHMGGAWARPCNVEGLIMSPAEIYKNFQRIKKNTRHIGIKVNQRYLPSEVFKNPPRPEDVTLEMLMAAQTHMGHNTASCNPKNSRYIHGIREDIHIISLEATAAHLRRASRVVEEVAYRGGLILVVGTGKGQMRIVTNTAELLGGCHLFTKWVPGSITNRDTILKNRAKKVVNQKGKELDGFDSYNGTARPLLPDLVICLDPLSNYTLLYECSLKNIPTIGIIDTNANPTWVTYVIPANDDSLRSSALIAGVLGRAGEAGKIRREEDEKKGIVPWSTSQDLKEYMDAAGQKKAKEQAEVMGKIQTGVEGLDEQEQEMLRSRYQEGEQPPAPEEADEVTGPTEETAATGATGASGATEVTEATQATQATDVTGATGATGATEATEATGTTGATEVTEATEATEAREAQQDVGEANAPGASGVDGKESQ